MKKLLSLALFLASFTFVLAQTTNPITPWMFGNPIPLIRPVVSSSSVQIPSLASAGLCLTTNASGTLSTSACGGTPFTTSTLAGLTDTSWLLSSANNLLSITTSSAPSRVTFTATTTPTFSTVNGIPVSNFLTGFGTSTQVAFYNSSSTLTSSAGLIFDSITGNLGIGTTTPSYKLHVIGTSTAYGFLATNGSQGSPAYSFVNDPTMGIHRQASGVIDVDATTQIRFDLGNQATIMNFTTTGFDPTPDNSVSLGTSSSRFHDLNMAGTATVGTLGTGLVKSTSGVLGNATSGTDYQAPLGSNYVSSTSCGAGLSCSSTTGAITITNIGVQSLSVSATSGLAISSATGTPTLYNNGVTSTVAGTNITQTCNGGTCTINTTTTPSFTSITYPDSTKTSTGYKDFSVNVLNTSSTTPVGASSTIQKMYLTGMTLTLISCSTDGSSITLQSDYRASSTPQTYGTSTFTGLVCSSSGASTTTFSNANIPAGSVLNFWGSSVPNSTTTLRIYGRAKET